MKKFIITILFLALVCSLAVAAQHDYNISNAPGATVRSDINDAYEAIATNNSGATAPASTYANMWWFDTSTNLLKIRDNSNSNWITVASKSGTTWIPYRAGTAVGTGATLTTDTDTSLTANSDSNVATQKAVKAYADAVQTSADTKISKTISGEIAAMTEKTAPVDADLIVIEDSAASNAKKKVQLGNISISGIPGNIDVFTSSGTWTRPAGVDEVYVKVWGAGGGGGGSNGSGTSGASGSGGGGGGYSEGLIAVTGNVTVTIGSGGSGGTTIANSTAGGTSSFAGTTTIQATGGGAGVLNGSSAVAGGVGSGGDINLNGQDGAESQSSTDTFQFITAIKPGEGGAAFGFQGGTYNRPPEENSGGGGAGRWSDLTTAQDGADGMAIVYY